MGETEKTVLTAMTPLMVDGEEMGRIFYSVLTFALALFGPMVGLLAQVAGQGKQEDQGVMGAQVVRVVSAILLLRGMHGICPTQKLIISVINLMMVQREIMEIWGHLDQRETTVIMESQVMVEILLYQERPSFTYPTVVGSLRIGVETQEM